MKKLCFAIATIALFLAAACTSEKKADVPVYVWNGWNDAKWGKTSDSINVDSIRADFQKWKSHGTVGVCIGCEDTAKVAVASKIAHELGMEYHAWIPTMLCQGKDSTWYTVNRLGESAYDKPVYVPYYRTMDPRNPEVQQYLIDKYTTVAKIADVDFIHLDYIRYADVILSRGLWDKYGLVMNEEYAKADYCYCDSCVKAFKDLTGIDIKAVEDPSKVAEWAQFRCDNITALVNMICDAVHAQGKKVSSAVFPGPASYAEKMVRQQWNKWNIDAVFPMNYNDFYLEPAEWVAKITAEEVQAVADKGIPVYSGLFICHDWEKKASIEDPEGHGLIPSEIQPTVKSVMETGAAGVCLFSAGSMTDAHWAEIEKAINLH